MSKGLILITGASGFIGSHVLDRVLKAGYNVRLTIRKEAQIHELKQLFPAHTQQMDFAVVPDITALDAFGKAMDGVDYIFHLASPMPMKGEDLQRDYVDPAVKGTDAILKAALETPSVKRVTIMASILSIMPMGGMAMQDLVIKENSNEPNPVDLNMEFPSGLDGHGLKYQASKILAHQATLQFIQQQKPHFTLTTLHPTFVLGPSLVQKSAEELSGVNMMFMRSLMFKKPLFPVAIVDVRDVADVMFATIDAKLERNGEECIISGKETSWDDIVAFMGRKYPKASNSLEPPFERAFKANAEKAEKLLGAKWKPMEEMIGSVLDQQLAFEKASKV
ncbi:NAD(P)-binding protein [Mollisia scopiformis]|uniref:NAD(P)-binding protein n=1 Tax=Mollisia scopiformis TaxID=149040 RepID=A0A194XCA5_MOLSC|nr:NAD(P)-binding protein [Mollisia scopiformis]KUJ17794.1 NAD(P)-binding protein [Mollisia scopiformis]